MDKHSPYPGDIVEARLEPGEMVINRNAVQAYGKENLEDLNASVPRFQEGALVDPDILRQQNDLKMSLANQYSHGGSVHLDPRERLSLQRSSGAPQSVTAPHLKPIGEPLGVQNAPRSNSAEPEMLGHRRIPNSSQDIKKNWFAKHSIGELKNNPRYGRGVPNRFQGQVTEQEQLGRLFDNKTLAEIAKNHPRALALVKKEYPGVLSEVMLRDKSKDIARKAQLINQQKFNEWKSLERDISYSHALSDEKRIEERRLQSAELNRELYKDEDPIMLKRRQKSELEEYAKARNKSKPEIYTRPKHIKTEKVDIGEQKFGLGESLRSFGRGFHKQLNPDAYKMGGGHINYPDGKQGYLFGSLVGLAGVGAAKKYGPGLMESAQQKIGDIKSAWNAPAGAEQAWTPEDMAGDIADDPNEAADLAAAYGEHQTQVAGQKEMGNLMADSSAGQWGAKTAKGLTDTADLIKEGGQTLLGGALGLAGAAKTGIEGAHKYMGQEGWGGGDSRYKSLGRGVGTGLSTLGTFLQEAASPGYIDQQKMLQSLDLKGLPSEEEKEKVEVEADKLKPKKETDTDVILEESAVDTDWGDVEEVQPGDLGAGNDVVPGEEGAVDASGQPLSKKLLDKLRKSASSWLYPVQEEVTQQRGGYIPYATGGFVSSAGTGSSPYGQSLNNSRRLLNFARRQYG